MLVAMKYTNFPAFESHVNNAAPGELFADTYLIVSKEPFERDRAYALLRERLLRTERLPDLCYKVFDGESLAIGALLDELQTPPFLSKRKVVGVRQVEKLNKPHLKILEANLGSISRKVKLLMTAAELTSHTTFYKKSELAGVVLDIAVKKGAQKEGELIEWVERTCGQCGKRMDRRVAQMLVRQLGDTALLPKELEKLYCYVGERVEITSQDVSAICSFVPAETIWQLSEALLRLDAATCLRIARGLLDGGTALLALIGQIRFQLQTGFQISSLLASGAGPQEVTRHYPYMVGGLLDKQCRLASEYGVSRFRRGLLALSDTEWKDKDSAADPEFLLERLLLELTR